jgi:hypothetical protein
MNFFCREFGEPELFKVKCRPGIVYAGTGNTWMIHFVTEFIYQPNVAHRPTSDQTLLEVINLGLIEARNGKFRDKAFQQPKIAPAPRRKTTS